MRTATGNAILIRLVASAMRDGAVATDSLEAMYDTYNYDFPGMVEKIYDFIRKCGITKVSKRTIKLANMAVDYFNNIERKIEMTNLKDLYVPCPICDKMMDYKEREQDYGVATYECAECGCSITALKSYIEMYATMAAQAQGVYNEPDDESCEDELWRDDVSELPEDEKCEDSTWYDEP